MTVGIGSLHHVGHVVHDFAAAADVYRRMGFRVPRPAFPVLPRGDGRAPRVVGAGNAHIDLRHTFIELVTVDGPTHDAQLVPLQVPEGAEDDVLASTAATIGRLAAALRRREGVHILVLQTRDADREAARLRDAGVECGPVRRVRRSAGADGAGAAAITVVEVDSSPGRSPEGRLALAEDLVDDAATTAPDHPNGASRLAGAVLCTPDRELDHLAQRYQRYLGRAPHVDGPVRRFDVQGVHLALVGRSNLPALLPGEHPPEDPAIVGYEVEVHDARAARDLAVRNGLPVRHTRNGLPFVPAEAALGAVVVLRGAADRAAL